MDISFNIVLSESSNSSILINSEVNNRFLTLNSSQLFTNRFLYQGKKAKFLIPQLALIAFDCH